MRSLIVLIILVFSIPASAGKLNRAEINSSLSTLNPVKLVHDGKEGHWFPKKQSETVLLLLEITLPLALNIIDSQSDQILSLKNSVKLFKSSLNLQSSYADYSKQMLDISLKYFSEIRPQEFAWYEGRVAIFVYGLVSGAVVIVVSAYVLDQIK